MYRSEVVILSYRFVDTLLGLVAATDILSANHHHLALRHPQSLLPFLSPSFSVSSCLVLYGLRTPNNSHFPYPERLPSSPDRGRSQRVAIERRASSTNASSPRCRRPLYDLALPRSLVPPRKPWTECARHRVLVISVAFPLVSSRLASSFLLPSRQSSRNSFRVPCPRTASSFLFFPSLSASLAAPVKFRSLVRFPPPSFSPPRPHFVDFACSSFTRSPDLPD